MTSKKLTSKSPVVLLQTRPVETMAFRAFWLKTGNGVEPVSCDFGRLKTP